MKTTSKILYISLCLLAIFSFLQCSRKPVSDCNSRKIEMLVDGIFEKQNFPIFLYSKPLEPEHNSDKRVNKVSKDSTKITYYLYSSNIKLPEKDYYLHYNKGNDSIKLNKINNLSNIDCDYYLIWMNFLEVNKDTTALKISFGHGLGNKLFKELTFTDTFDVQNCKWIVHDSTLWND